MFFEENNGCEINLWQQKGNAEIHIAGSMRRIGLSLSCMNLLIVRKTFHVLKAIITRADYPKPTFCNDLIKPDYSLLDFCMAKRILQAKHLRQLKRKVNVLAEKMAKAKNPLLDPDVGSQLVEEW